MKLDTKSILRAVNEGKEGRIVMKPGSRKLYFDFQLNEKRVEKTTGYVASSGNIVKARAELDAIIDSVRLGAFSFATRFPTASAVEKAYHAQFETAKRATLLPHQVRFRDYVCGTEANDFKDGWLETRLPLIGTNNVRYEYKRDIEYWLLKLYGDLTFAELTGDRLHVSLKEMVKADGTMLSGKRMRNIFVPFKKVWRSARNKHGWNHLPDPIAYLVEEKYLPKMKKKRVPVFRVKDLLRVLAELDNYHRMVVLVMVLTGMINSEIAGLRKSDLEFGEEFGSEGNWIHVQFKKTLRGEEGEALKTEYRLRDIPMTEKLHALLLELKNQSPDDFVFTRADGTPYSYEALRYAWRGALKRSELRQRRLYSLRHTFAAWAMTAGKDVNQLEALMGHGSKEMIFNRYGKYVKGLEKDKVAIIEFFGAGFLV